MTLLYYEMLFTKNGFLRNRQAVEKIKNIRVAPTNFVWVKKQYRISFISVRFFIFLHKTIPAFAGTWFVEATLP